MGASSDIVSLRISLRYKDLDEFVERYAENISSAGLFLRTKAPKPQGTKVRFELLLATGEGVLSGEGVVASVRTDATPGMGIRFTSLSEASRATVDRIVGEHGDGSLAPTPLSTTLGGSAKGRQDAGALRRTAGPSPLFSPRPSGRTWSGPKSATASPGGSGPSTRQVPRPSSFDRFTARHASTAPAPRRDHAHEPAHDGAESIPTQQTTSDCAREEPRESEPNPPAPEEIRPSGSSERASATEDLARGEDERTRMTDERASMTDDLAHATDEIPSATEERASIPNELGGTTDELRSATEERASIPDELGGTTDELRSAADELESPVDPLAGEDTISIPVDPRAFPPEPSVAAEATHELDATPISAPAKEATDSTVDVIDSWDDETAVEAPTGSVAIEESAHAPPDANGPPRSSIRLEPQRERTVVSRDGHARSEQQETVFGMTTEAPVHAPTERSDEGFTRKPGESAYTTPAEASDERANDRSEEKVEERQAEEDSTGTPDRRHMGSDTDPIALIADDQTRSEVSDLGLVAKESIEGLARSDRVGIALFTPSPAPPSPRPMTPPPMAPSTGELVDINPVELVASDWSGRSERAFDSLAQVVEDVARQQLEHLTKNLAFESSAETSNQDEPEQHQEVLSGTSPAADPRSSDVSRSHRDDADLRSEMDAPRVIAKDETEDTESASTAFDSWEPVSGDPSECEALDDRDPARIDRGGASEHREGLANRGPPAMTPSPGPAPDPDVRPNEVFPPLLEPAIEPFAAEPSDRAPETSERPQTAADPLRPAAITSTASAHEGPSTPREEPAVGANATSSDRAPSAPAPASSPRAEDTVPVESVPEHVLKLTVSGLKSAVTIPPQPTRGSSSTGEQTPLRPTVERRKSGVEPQRSTTHEARPRTDSAARATLPRSGSPRPRAPSVSGGLESSATATVSIDLGASWLRMAALRNGELALIPIDGDEYTPALVAVTDSGDLVAGRGAKDIASRDPSMAVSPRHVLSALRGERDIDEAIAQGRVSHDRGRVTVTLGGRSFDIREVFVTLLSLARGAIEAALLAERFRVVFAVPDDLGPLARTILKESCREARLPIARFESEPAALIHALRLDTLPIETALLVDIGVSHTCVALARVDRGAWSIVASTRSSSLSAGRIDADLAEMTLSELATQTGQDFRSDPALRAGLIDEVEAARRGMNDANAMELTLRVPDAASGGVVERTIKLPRSRVHQCAQPTVDKLLTRVQELLRNESVHPRTLGAVGLVGSGAAFAPIAEGLRRMTSVDPIIHRTPERAVVMGLARSGTPPEREATPRKEGILATDVGIELPGGRFRPLIKAGTPLPTSLKRRHPTIRDYQSEMEIQFYQGTGEHVRDCVPLGFVMLKGLPHEARGRIEVDVLLEIDAEGVLTAVLHEGTAKIESRIVVPTQQTPSDKSRDLAPSEARNPSRDLPKTKPGLLGRLLGRH